MATDAGQAGRIGAAGAAPPHVVVIGGGFGGLYAARNLADAAVRLTLVDRRNHHLFQPMLYQVATAALSPNAIASPIRSLLRDQRNCEVLMAEAVRVDLAHRTVHYADGACTAYDYLVVATGARHSYFGNDQWEPNAPGLKSLEDALDIRRRVLLAFERAEREKDPVRRHALLTFVVVGGGPTGVEMAGAVAEIRRYALKRDFRRIDPREATVLLLEGGPRILPSYSERSSDAAKEELRKLGVEVRTETLVTEITDRHVNAAGWTIPTRTVIWAAGNVASPLLTTFGTPLDRQGRAIVEPDCSVPGHPEVFVIGDAAHFEDPKLGVIPGVAPTAIQMGQYVARTIRGDLAGSPRTAFQYWDKGSLAVVGRGQAVAEFGTWRIRGLFAWLVWVFVHILYLIGFRNRVIVMIEWAWAYWSYQRGARLITGEQERMRPAAAPPGAEPVATGERAEAGAGWSV